MSEKDYKLMIPGGLEAGRMLWIQAAELSVGQKTFPHPPTPKFLRTTVLFMSQGVFGPIGYSALFF